MDPRNAGIEDLVCDESFQRYCRGEEEADIVFWEAWLRDNPDQLQVVNAAKRLFEVLNGGQGNRMEQKAALKDAIARRAQFESTLLNNRQTAAPARVLQFPGRSLLKYAASIIVLIMAGVLVYMQSGKRKAGVTQLAVYEYHTGPQDRKTIILPDSSMVMLNGNSHLIVNRDFDPHHRQVSITGEAFFGIKHDSAFPFLVNTSQYTIRVLGTTFNVRSYPGKDTTETTLLTGKIEILQGADNAKAKVVLKPNEKFILNASAVAQQERSVQINRGMVVKPVMEMATHHLMETSWARRKMEIYDKPLAEIAAMLQAWYGIKIRFADEAVKSYRYTATFNEETIFHALGYLQQSYPFTYSIEDDCIVIAKR